MIPSALHWIERPHDAGERLRYHINRRCSGRAGQRAICTSSAQLNVGGVPPPAAELRGCKDFYVEDLDGYLLCFSEEKS
jgi:hypothetical protein